MEWETFAQRHSLRASAGTASSFSECVCSSLRSAREAPPRLARVAIDSTVSAVLTSDAAPSTSAVESGRPVGPVVAVRRISRVRSMRDRSTRVAIRRSPRRLVSRRARARTVCSCVSPLSSMPSDRRQSLRRHRTSRRPVPLRRARAAHRDADLSGDPGAFARGSVKLPMPGDFHESP